jgi:hypothetical protein
MPSDRSLRGESRESAVEYRLIALGLAAAIFVVVMAIAANVMR